MFPKMRSEVDYSFAGLDLDGDGRVSKKEWDTALIHDTFDWHLDGNRMLSRGARLL